MISFSEDPAVTDAVRHWRGKAVFPTDMGSAEIRGFSRELHLRSVLSARTTNARYLQTLSDNIDEALAGTINKTQFRVRQMKLLKELGYDPAIGFPEDMADIPPAERGSLQDLSSEARLNLIFETNTAMARNYGRVVEGNQPEALFLFPAWELVRLRFRETPRGKKRVHERLVDDPANAWPRRWAEAGESVGWEGAAKSPMIALKHSPIWQALGAGEGGHTDALGNPYPPFAFNSGMDWRAAPRAECIDLGLISRGEKSEPMQARLSPGHQEIQDALAKLGEDFRAELLRELAEEREAA